MNIKIHFAMLAMAVPITLSQPTQAAHQGFGQSQLSGPGGNLVSRGQTKPIAPVFPGSGANLQNCRGAVITGGAYSNYSIQNAIGNGLDIGGTFSLVSAPQIFGASGDGIVIHGNGTQWNGATVDKAVIYNANNGLVIVGDGCTIDGGLIENCRGVGILIIGNKNNVVNMTIRNCRQPLVIQGTGNQVTWASGPTLSPSGL